jgi:hypothetical protein
MFLTELLPNIPSTELVVVLDQPMMRRDILKTVVGPESITRIL